ncbi:peptidoglycan DD-metalloendopeptidase family protein [Enterococcus mundtii]
MEKKSTYKLVSFVFLSQMLLTTPLQVLADEQVFSADQPVTAEAQTETTTDSSDTTGEDNTTDTTTDGTEESTPPSTGDSSEPTTPDTSEPTEPSTPEETKPTEPTEPTEPTKPTEPTQPSQPQKPTPPSTGGSTGETQPTTPQPSQPTQPVTPPAAPVAPTPAPAAPVAQEVRQPSATTPIQDLVPSSQETDEGSIHFEKDESVESFIRKIGESSREIGQEHDLYASVMIAQAILESASGQSQLAQAPNYNLFGIKGTHEGNGVTFATQEDAGDGTLYTIQATFRKYANYEESLEDYAKLMTEGLTGNSEFYSGAWKSNAETYKEATEFLTGRYATDTRYNEKLNGLIETYDLEQYDKEVAGPEVNKEGYIVPLRNYTISSPFGPRGGEFHRGLDFAAPQGEPIYASKAGTVIKAEFHPSWGNYVAIEHEDGTTALYAHQQEYIVKVGDEVEQGQIIGFVGSTGNSTGSHLHFEISRDNSLAQAQLIDPATILFAE